jgi:hypothetical protein
MTQNFFDDKKKVWLLFFSAPVIISTINFIFFSLPLPQLNHKKKVSFLYLKHARKG